MLSTRDPARDLSGTERVVANRANHGYPDAQPVRVHEHDATPATMRAARAGYLGASPWPMLPTRDPARDLRENYASWSRAFASRDGPGW